MNSKKLKVIKKWVKEQGFTIQTDGKNEVDFGEYVVSINKNEKHVNYSLLHECGHIIGDKKINRTDNEILDKGYVDVNFARTKLYKYKKLQEEMIAWEEGYKLSKKLGIKINKNKYDLFAAKHFNTYVKYL